MSLPWGCNQRRSVWEWIQQTEIPGDVIVCTVGWPNGDRNSFVELYPDIIEESETERKTLKDAHEQVVEDIRLTHYANGQPMIPHRTIRQWFCYWLPDTSSDSVQKLCNSIKSKMNFRHTAFILDCSDWDDRHHEWITVIQHILTSVPTKPNQIHLYLPHASMVKVLEENMGGNIQT